MQGKNDVAPAKRRYDRKMPFVSFRASRVQLEKIDERINDSGISKGWFLRRTLGIEVEKKDRIYRKERRDGYRKAKEKYGVFVWCNGCRILVNSEDMKVKVGNAVAEVYNWYHKGCKPQDMADDECELFDEEVGDEWST